MSEDSKAEALFKTYWDSAMKESPESATYYGYPGLNDQWTEFTHAAIERRKATVVEISTGIAKINAEKLSRENRLSLQILKFQNDLDRHSFDFPDYYLSLDQMNGIHVQIAQVLMNSAPRTIKDYQDIIQRLTRAPILLGQVIELLSEGMTKGITPMREAIRGVPDQIAGLTPRDANKSPALSAFQEMNAQISASEQASLKADALAAYEKFFKPAMQKLRDFAAKDYLPAARTSTGYSELPHGRAWYDLFIRRHTTTSMNAEEVHALGLQEVARIQEEIIKVMKQVGYEGSVAEFQSTLKDNAKFYYQRASDLIEGYRAVSTLIYPKLMQVIGKFPRLPFGVEPVPDYQAQGTPAAYMMPGSTVSGRPGIFYANTSDLPSRPKFNMVSLTLHELIPGHHLQLALQDEIENVPDFRKGMSFTAYGEGWALYSEYLGQELGLYKDPYDLFGRLKAEMLRACRLVIDTGLHAKGWTRDQAIQFFGEQMGQVDSNTIAEVDRYIVMPGQALAYKIGEQKILSLRREAEAKLGEKFDVRKFHDVVLSAGALPLSILEDRIHDWVKATESSAR